MNDSSSHILNGLQWKFFIDIPATDFIQKENAYFHWSGVMLSKEFLEYQSARTIARIGELIKKYAMSLPIDEKRRLIALFLRYRDVRGKKTGAIDPEKIFEEFRENCQVLVITGPKEEPFICLESPNFKPPRHLGFGCVYPQLRKVR